MEPVTLTLNSTGGIADVDFVQWIMNEIEDKKMTRKDVAQTYAILIQKGHKEFLSINEAILRRWSPSGFRWIKEQAWKINKAEREKVAYAKYGGCTCMGQSECDFCKER